MWFCFSFFIRRSINGGWPMSPLLKYCPKQTRIFYFSWWIAVLNLLYVRHTMNYLFTYYGEVSLIKVWQLNLWCQWFLFSVPPAFLFSGLNLNKESFLHSYCLKHILIKHSEHSFWSKSDKLEIVSRVTYFQENLLTEVVELLLSTTGSDIPSFSKYLMPAQG